jgi:hypothetical protein
MYKVLVGVIRDCSDEVHKFSRTFSSEGDHVNVIDKPVKYL